MATAGIGQSSCHSISLVDGPRVGGLGHKGDEDTIVGDFCNYYRQVRFGIKLEPMKHNLKICSSGKICHIFVGQHLALGMG